MNILEIILVCIVINFFVLNCNPAKADTVKTTIVQTAAQHGLDPAVALAIAEVESTFNPKATGKAGEIGLFQLHPRFFKNASYNIDANVELGVKHLLYWQKRCPTKKNKTWVNCYNRGYRPVVNPKTTPYYRKFIKAYQKHKIPPLVAVVD